MNAILITDALEVLAQLVPLIQNALANKQDAISIDEWDAAINSRNAALAQLDKDIAATPDAPT